MPAVEFPHIEIALRLWVEKPCPTLALRAEGSLTSRHSELGFISLGESPQVKDRAVSNTLADQLTQRRRRLAPRSQQVATTQQVPE